MLMQVISLDGVSIDVPPGMEVSKIKEQAASRFESISCGPGADAPSSAVCTTLLHLMPSSRAEVWVTYRDVNGRPARAPYGAEAVLRTNGDQAGPGGDTWPAIDLARVRFTVAVSSFDSVSVVQRGSQRVNPVEMSASLQSANTDVPSDPTCTAVPAGHKRRIFFNAVPHYGLGLGYEEVDENGVSVPGSFVDVSSFNPAAPTVCLPLAAGDLPVTERWELVNLSGSDHNFHIHQAHFSVLTAADLATTGVPEQLLGRAVVMDSLPLRHADGLCQTVADWRRGACQTHVPTVEITFTVAGDFVYHCHILAHEDGGMMAVIRVRSNTASNEPGVVKRMLSSVGFDADEPRQPLLPRIQGGMCRGARALD